MIFYYHTNKTHFHKKGFALGLVLRVRVFLTRKWPISDFVSRVCIVSFPFVNCGSATIPTFLFISCGRSDKLILASVNGKRKCTPREYGPVCFRSLPKELEIICTIYHLHYSALKALAHLRLFCAEA